MLLVLFHLPCQVRLDATSVTSDIHIFFNVLVFIFSVETVCEISTAFHFVTHIICFVIKGTFFSDNWFFEFKLALN
jgi:hypothetical protein